MLSRLHIMKLSKEKIKRRKEEKTLCMNNKADRQKKKRSEMKSMLHIIRKEECLHDFDFCCDKKRKKEEKKKRQRQRKIKYSSYTYTNYEEKKHD